VRKDTGNADDVAFLINNIAETHENMKNLSTAELASGTIQRIKAFSYLTKLIVADTA